MGLHHDVEHEGAWGQGGAGGGRGVVRVSSRDASLPPSRPLLFPPPSLYRYIPPAITSFSPHVFGSVKALTDLVKAAAIATLYKSRLQCY